MQSEECKEWSSGTELIRPSPAATTLGGVGAGSQALKIAEEISVDAGWVGRGHMRDPPPPLGGEVFLCGTLLRAFSNALAKP